MASKIFFSNLSSNGDYTILLNGQDMGTILPLKTNTIDVESRKYARSNEEGLPSTRKSIHVRIGDEKTVYLKIVGQNFAIGIVDEKEKKLNDKHGFLCGYVADGVHIYNHIS